MATEAFVADKVQNSSTGITSSSLGKNGYVRYGNGFTMQWGQQQLTKDSTNIYFPTKFTNMCSSVVIAMYPHYESDWNYAVGTITKDYFTIVAYGGERVGPYKWIAVGY